MKKKIAISLIVAFIVFGIITFIFTKIYDNKYDVLSDYVNPKIKSTKEEKDIINNAYSKGIRLSPLSQYYKNNKENKNIYVMNYSSLDSEKIDLIVEKLKQCI